MVQAVAHLSSFSPDLAVEAVILEAVEAPILEVSVALAAAISAAAVPVAAGKSKQIIEPRAKNQESIFLILGSFFDYQINIQPFSKNCGTVVCL
jgi:hypothetical protein